jgi:hypothetical protein
MHFGKNNKKYPYYLNNNGMEQEIERSTLEKDIGIYIIDDQHHIRLIICWQF